jgi:PAS domain S-box-containing protein
MNARPHPVIRVFMPPPVRDDEASLTARKLWSILVSLAAFVTAMFPLSAMLVPAQAFRTFLIAGIFDAGAVALLVICPRRPRLGSWLLVAFGTLIFIGAAATAGGIRAPALTGFLIMIGIAGVLLGANAAAITGAVCVSAGFLLLLAEQFGQLPASQVHHTPASLWWLNVIFICMAVMLQLVVAWVMRRSALKARALESAKLQVEAELRESEERYRAMVEGSLDSVTVQVDNVIVYANPSAARLFGAARAGDLVGRRILDLVHPDYLEAALARKRSIDERGIGGPLAELRYLRLDGTPVDVEVQSFAITYNGRKAFQITARDIGERKKVERALFESEQHLRRLFETMNSGFSLHEIVLDPAGKPCDYRFLEVNPAFERLTGLKRRDLIGRRVLEVLPKTEQYWIDRFCRVAVTGATDRFENFSQELGRHYEVLCYAPKAGQFAVLSFDVTERVRHEESIRERERRFLRLIENASDLITIVDTGNVITYQSPSIERALGYRPEEIVGRDLFMLVHPDDIERARERMGEAFARPGRAVEGEYRIRHADGTWRTFAAVGRSVAGDAQLIINSRDVTDQRALEVALRQSQKIEAVGRLSGGIAHDFNNLLTAMKGYGSILQESDLIGDEERNHLREMMKAVDRATRLTKQLLAFSRQQAVTLRPVQLNQLVTSMFGLLQHMLGETVRIDLRLAADDLEILADTGMIEQVLLNLAVNARDAMGEGGTLTVATAFRDLSEADAALLGAGASAGAQAKLTVADTGCGIAPEILQRIFEPFFTTKAIGHGTGLGLAMVHGIVRQHGGAIVVASLPGRGATFDIYLPIHRPAARLPRDAAPEAALGGRPRGGAETILVVEDEASVRDLVTLVLTRFGYTTLTASDGAGALVLWGRHRDRIRMLVTDAVMPGGLSGTDLARRILQENPDLPVICMSGHLPTRGQEQEPLPDGAAFLRKPFDAMDLAVLVRAGLDGVRA